VRFWESTCLIWPFDRISVFELVGASMSSCILSPTRGLSDAKMVTLLETSFLFGIASISTKTTYQSCRCVSARYKIECDKLELPRIPGKDLNLTPSQKRWALDGVDGSLTSPTIPRSWERPGTRQNRGRPPSFAQVGNRDIVIDFEGVEGVGCSRLK
jgi:hypothetical protein